MAKEKCIGKVIKIPNEYIVIISANKYEVNIGDDVAIYEPGDEILDPDTGEKLGDFDFIKTKLEISETYDNYSVCQRVVYERRSPVFGALSPLLEDETVEKIKKINVNPEHNDNLKIKNSKVSIGDPVKLL